MSENPMTEPELIGLRIRAARVQKSMSQAELAEKANISLPTMNAIENGRSKMLVTSFKRIIEALQVSSDAILRADVPVVNTLYQHEFGELLSDCTPAEMEMLLTTVKNLKATMRSIQSNQ